MIRTLKSVREMQETAEKLRLEAKRIGFVPTMGYLHEGHLSLVDLVRTKSDVTVMSIFVNPAQFGPHEDLDKYPRDFERDEMLAASRGVDIIFYPTPEMMYPAGYKTWVDVDDLTEVLCGASRPGHFRGVTTVVTKLFNIIKPHCVALGQKDAQQAAVIETMIRDLNVDTEFILGPIVREIDGLAMSSRNVNLLPDERKEAPVLQQTLKEIAKTIKNGHIDIQSLLNAGIQSIESMTSGRVDYLEARCYPSLEPIENISGKLLIALAVYFKNVRLIDNVIVKM